MNAEEMQRRRSLEALEDGRLRLAERMAGEGIAPERMLLAATGRGGYAGLFRHNNQPWLLASPDFGQPGEFWLTCIQSASIRREEVWQPAEGLGGAFGFGKKGARGFNLTIGLPQNEITIPFVTNRGSAMIVAQRSPVLSTARRKANSNPVWSFTPIDKRLLEKIESELAQILA